MRVRKVKTVINFKVPSWEHCNLLNTDLSPNAATCRMCVKTAPGSYTCVLTNDVLLTRGGNMPLKTEACKRLSAGFHDEIVDTSFEGSINNPMTPRRSGPTDVKVNPQEVIKMTIKNYRRNLQNLLDQGYPYDMAANLAEGATLR